MYVTQTDTETDMQTRVDRNTLHPARDHVKHEAYTHGDIDVISIRIYAGWFSPPSCG